MNLANSIAWNTPLVGNHSPSPVLSGEGRGGCFFGSWSQYTHKAKGSLHWKSEPTLGKEP
jgi:hypothetical protein